MEEPNLSFLFVEKLLDFLAAKLLKTYSEKVCTGFNLLPNLEAAGKLGAQLA